MLAGGWTLVGKRRFRDRKRNDVWWYGGSLLTKASYTWGGAQNFFRFLQLSGRGAQVGGPTRLGLGDLIQVMNSSGHVYHTMVVTQVCDEDLQLSYHSPDHLDEPLAGIRSRLRTGDSLIYWRISDIKT